EITEAVIEEGRGVRGKLANGQTFNIELTNEFIQAELAKKFNESGTNYTFKSSSSSQWLIGLLSYAPLLVFIGLWIFMMRQMQSGGNKALSFGKSRAKLLSNQQKRVTFKDVAAGDEAKEELQEVIDFRRGTQKM